MPNNTPPNAPLPRWADILLTLWVVVVGIVYYGGYFSPFLGAFTNAGAGLYGVTLLVSAAWLALRFLRRNAP